MQYYSARTVTLMKKHFVLALALLVCLGPVVRAESDTPETRRREAERYVQAVPPKELFADMAGRMASNMPEEQREPFKKMMTEQLDIAALTKAMIDSMVKHFTTDELKALADFYGSPVGKSAMKKFGAYMSDLMPTIQAEMMKAQAKAGQAQPGGSPH